MALPIGIQLYSVNDYASKDFTGTLLKLKEMGYDFVELSGTYGIPSKDLRKAFRETKMKPIAAHCFLHEFGDDPLAFIASYKALGVKYLVLACIPEEWKPKQGEDNSAIFDRIAYIGRLCSEQGIQFLFHNHDWDIETTVDGLALPHYLNDHVPNDYLQPEVDVGWVQVAGHDIAEYMSHYYGYLPIVHAKDFLGTLDETKCEEGKPINRHCYKDFKFCPLGEGNLDLEAALKGSIDNYSKYIVVEQDSPEGADSLECARISRENLRKLGW